MATTKALEIGQLGRGLSVDDTSGEVTAIAMDTDDVPEGSNLYHTSARVYALFSAGEGISISPSGEISNNSVRDYGLITESVTTQNDYGSIA